MLIGQAWWPYKKKEERDWPLLWACAKKRPCEDMSRRWPSAAHGENSHQTLTLLTP